MLECSLTVEPFRIINLAKFDWQNEDLTEHDQTGTGVMWLDRPVIGGFTA